jgi:hypothetical protein
VPIETSATPVDGPTGIDPVADLPGSGELTALAPPEIAAEPEAPATPPAPSSEPTPALVLNPAGRARTLPLDPTVNSVYSVLVFAAVMAGLATVVLRRAGN